MFVQEYADRCVKVIFNKTPTEVTVTIKDDGKGFEWDNYLDFDPKRAFDMHGRGILTANKFSFDSVEYKKPGNEVTVSMKL